MENENKAGLQYIDYPAYLEWKRKKELEANPEYQAKMKRIKKRNKIAGLILTPIIAVGAVMGLWWKYGK